MGVSSVKTLKFKLRNSMVLLVCLFVALHCVQQLKLPNFQHEVPGPRFEPAASEVGGENSNR